MFIIERKWWEKMIELGIMDECIVSEFTSHLKDAEPSLNKENGIKIFQHLKEHEHCWFWSEAQFLLKIDIDYPTFQLMSVVTGNDPFRNAHRKRKSTPMWSFFCEHWTCLPKQSLLWFVQNNNIWSRDVYEIRDYTSIRWSNSKNTSHSRNCNLVIKFDVFKLNSTVE